MPPRAIAMFAAMFCLTVLAGCAKPIIVNAFPGPNLSDTEVATLNVDFKVRLLELDGQSIPGIPPGIDPGERYDPRILRLLPGDHQMLIGVRPYIETNSYPIYSYMTTTDCEGHCRSTPMVVGYNTTTTFHQGSRENERIAFTLAPGRRYRLTLDDPPDWFYKREVWSAQLIKKTNAWRDPVISTSLGRELHIEPPPQPQLAKAGGG